MNARTLLNLLKFQLCLLIIMLIFAKVNGQPLSDSFYFYLISIIGLWGIITIFGQDEEEIREED